MSLCLFVVSIKYGLVQWGDFLFFKSFYFPAIFSVVCLFWLLSLSSSSYFCFLLFFSVNLVCVVTFITVIVSGGGVVVVIIVADITIISEGIITLINVNYYGETSII